MFFLDYRQCLFELKVMSNDRSYSCILILKIKAKMKTAV